MRLNFIWVFADLLSIFGQEKNSAGYLDLDLFSFKLLYSPATATETDRSLEKLGKETGYPLSFDPAKFQHRNITDIWGKESWYDYPDLDLSKDYGCKTLFFTAGNLPLRQSGESLINHHWNRRSAAIRNGFCYAHFICNVHDMPEKDIELNLQVKAIEALHIQWAEKIPIDKQCYPQLNIFYWKLFGILKLQEAMPSFIENFIAVDEDILVTEQIPLNELKTVNPHCSLSGTADSICHRDMVFLNGAIAPMNTGFFFGTTGCKSMGKALRKYLYLSATDIKFVKRAIMKYYLNEQATFTLFLEEQTGMNMIKNVARECKNDKKWLRHWSWDNPFDVGYYEKARFALLHVMLLAPSTQRFTKSPWIEGSPFIHVHPGKPLQKKFKEWADLCRIWKYKNNEELHRACWWTLP